MYAAEFWLVVLAIIGVGLAIIAAGIYTVYYHLRNRFSKPTTVRARVLHKRTRQIEFTPEEDFICTVTFDVAGRLMHMVVSHEVWNSLDEGDEGLLIYQGDQFKAFSPSLGWQR